MSKVAKWRGGAAAVIVIGLAVASPAIAQDGEEAALDHLIEASATPDAALALARNQIAVGELLGAAATLERVLIAQPGASDVRLAYAAVLCRLDDPQAAKLELAALTEAQGSTLAWDEARAACGAELARHPSRSFLSGEIAAGLAFDSDALGSLQIQPLGFAQSDEGVAGVVTAQLHGRAALGRTFIYSDLRGLTKHDLGGPNIDYQFGTAALGLGHAIGAGEIALGGLFRYGRIANQRYVTEYGGELRLSFPKGNNGRLTLQAEAVKQDFAVSSSDGWNYGASLTYTGRPSERLSWFLSGAGEFKSAAFGTDEYYAARLSGGLALQLGQHGTYLALNSTARYVDFGEEPFFLPRSEWRFYNRAAVGIPLGHSGLAVEGALTHSTRNYNQASFINDYSSLGGELRLIWKFGKGSTAP